MCVMYGDICAMCVEENCGVRKGKATGVVVCGFWKEMRVCKLGCRDNVGGTIA